MRAAFAAQFDSLLCDGRPTEAETIALAHMAAQIPDALDMRGFDCFFSRAKEDVQLWSMLDAWRETGLGESAALAKVHAGATDPRTARRFLSADATMRQRAPVPYQHFANENEKER